MTEHLAATGAPVHAIELDASLARKLQQLTQQFPTSPWFLATSCKPTFPRLPPGAACAFTVTCLTTLLRQFCIICWVC